MHHRPFEPLDEINWKAVLAILATMVFLYYVFGGGIKGLLGTAAVTTFALMIGQAG